MHTARTRTACRRTRRILQKKKHAQKKKEATHTGDNKNGRPQNTLETHQTTIHILTTNLTNNNKNLEQIRRVGISVPMVVAISCIDLTGPSGHFSLRDFFFFFQCQFLHLPPARPRRGVSALPVDPIMDVTDLITHRRPPRHTSQQTQSYRTRQQPIDSEGKGTTCP